MAEADDARWTMRGESIVAVIGRVRRISVLPGDLKGAPGPTVIVAQRFDESPVGAFRSLSIGEPARLGARLGYFFGVVVVDSPRARRSERQYWGFPCELGNLVWAADGDVRRLLWSERDLAVSAVGGRLHVPLVMGMRFLQRRVDGPVVIPAKLFALARKSNVHIEVPRSDPLSAVAGEHKGLVLDGLVTRRSPARRPLGVFSTLRAPLRAPEPGILGCTAPDATSHAERVHSPGTGAYSSAG